MTSLDDVTIELSVLLGTATMPVHQFLRMGRGAVIALETHAEEDLKLLANGVPVARGEVVLEGDQIAVTITEMLAKRKSRSLGKET
ncbi:FliM/FliN family flagellar motor switch protein [Lutibaculum baratangense]|uniref:Flagellar motor switch protein n=1 Tax=Lutibaculum baratangense AMV1 TaxID=631454 RepID=V4RMQ1_9HYPH|nr:FliM/FliN family flagellar motor switch protein [Lutibaculum baratangense]ESR26554.1 flagellar motor switch protein [Lutibaculum baratangense AMV1]